MSIEMDNPTTLTEKIDAAANYIAQIRLATMIGDQKRVDFAIEKASALLFEATQMIQDTEPT